MSSIYSNMTVVQLKETVKSKNLTQAIKGYYAMKKDELIRQLQIHTEESAPVVNIVSSIVEETIPIVEETMSIVEETMPIVQPASKNIKTEQFFNNEFYFTIKSKKTAGDDYESPLYKAIENIQDSNITICREKPSNSTGADGKAKAFKSYGVLDFSTLNLIWKSNHHLYEVIRAKHKPYFDIEFKFIDEIQKETIFNKIIDLIKSSFEFLNVPFDYKQHCAVSENIGVGEYGLFGGLTKASFHLIVNNGYKFSGYDQSNKFAKYLEQRIRLEEEYQTLITEEGIAIDLKVYNKNRCFKLPYQSKANSTRIQIPSQRYQLTDFLISYNINDYQTINTEKIVLSFDAKTASVSGASGAVFNGNWNWSAIEEFKNSMVNVDHTVKVDCQPSQDIEYLVDSIYNGREVSYKTWFCVGSAIKRAMNGDDSKALELFTKWTQKYDKSATIASIKPAFDGFSSSACGLKTLMSLGRLCNPDLDKYCDTVHTLLFKTDKMPSDITRVEVNKRYLDFADIIPNFSNSLTIEDYLEGKRVDNKCLVDFRANTFFIKSAMGTGKTFNFINFIKLEDSRKPLRVIYLSSRQAFAESTAADFKSINLSNYLKYKSDLTHHRKIIISLESIDKLSQEQVNDNDLLVIDESESIFNIFSSSTIINAKYLDKIKVFMTLIRKSKMVFTMDAFLSNRSIMAVMACRQFDKTNSIYYINNFQYEQRFYRVYRDEKTFLFGKKFLNLGENQLIYSLKQKLKEGKRCCLVTGSTKFGHKVIENVKQLNKKIKFYNSSNPLSLAVNVNNEWSDCDLLIYSPTITCGISYTNPDVLFDNLFIYAVNIGSCHFRDIIQAHKRIRHFNDPEIKVALNTRFRGFNNEQYPVYIDEIKEIFHDYKKELFGNTQINSILDEQEIAWLYDIHCFNIMEKNIHSIHLNKVARHYFELENIQENAGSDQRKNDGWNVKDVTTQFWSYNSISKITFDEFNDIEKKIKLKENTLTELQEYYRYIFDSRTDYFQNKSLKEFLFNCWCFSDKDRQYMLNIIDFNKIVKNNGTIQRKADDLELLEFYNTKALAYKHLYEILTELKIVKKSSDEKTRHYVDVYHKFSNLDLEPLVEKYKQLNSKSINQLFENHYLDTNGGKTKFTTKTMTAIINKLLKDNFGYSIEKVDECRKTINGKKRDVSIYMLSAQTEDKTSICLFDIFKQ